MDNMNYKLIRQTARVSQKQLAGRLGVTQTTISRFENGITYYSSLNTRNMLKFQYKLLGKSNQKRVTENVEISEMFHVVSVRAKDLIAAIHLLVKLIGESYKGHWSFTDMNISKPRGFWFFKTNQYNFTVRYHETDSSKLS